MSATATPPSSLEGGFTPPEGRGACVAPPTSNYVESPTSTRDQDNSSNVPWLSDDLWRCVLSSTHLMNHNELCALEGCNRQLRRLARADATWQTLCERSGYREDLVHGQKFSDWRGWKAYYRLCRERERRRARQQRQRRLLRLTSQGLFVILNFMPLLCARKTTQI